MAQLVDDSIRNYTTKLASGAPAPGGGSAAAYTGAIGVSLTCMVGSLTEGRAKYAEYADFITGLLEQAHKTLNEFLVLVDEDVVVFNAMSAAYKMPKESAAEKALRTEAIQAALKDCTITPFKIMELCVRSLRLTAEAIGKTNVNVVSDLGVAALCLKAAVQGAWLNILINLNSLRDAGFAAEYREKGEGVLNEAMEAADDIYESVRRQLCS